MAGFYIALIDRPIHAVLYLLLGKGCVPNAHLINFTAEGVPKSFYRRSGIRSRMERRNRLSVLIHAQLYRVSIDVNLNRTSVKHNGDVVPSVDC